MRDILDFVGQHPILTVVLTIVIFCGIASIAGAITGHPSP